MSTSVGYFHDTVYVYNVYMQSRAIFPTCESQNRKSFVLYNPVYDCYRKLSFSRIIAP